MTQEPKPVTLRLAPIRGTSFVFGELSLKIGDPPEPPKRKLWSTFLKIVGGLRAIEWVWKKTGPVREWVGEHAEDFLSFFSWRRWSSRAVDPNGRASIFESRVWAWAAARQAAATTAD